MSKLLEDLRNEQKHYEGNDNGKSNQVKNIADHIESLELDESELQNYRSLGTYDSIRRSLESTVDMISSYKLKQSNLIKQVSLLEKSIESALPNMLPKMRETFEPILNASKGISNEKEN